MNNIIIEKLRVLKESYEQTVSKINEIENISSDFGYTNLKVHNISHYLYQAMESGLITYKQSISTFDDITMFEYEYFKEWESENLNYVKREYIGRTSSFNYGTNWYGDVIDNYSIEMLLEGKTNILVELFKEMEINIYQYLVENKDVNELFVDMEEDDIIEQIEDESDFLETFLSDLETLNEIVLEAKKAYDYLESYKNEENEYSIARDYLEHDLSERYSEYKADELYDTLLDSIDKLNTVKQIEASFTVNEQNKYDVIFNVDGKQTIVNTDIDTDHELSKLFIESTMLYLNERINASFVLPKVL